jgi:hypothetical protein
VARTGKHPRKRAIAGNQKVQGERAMLHNFAKAVRELQRTFGDAFGPYRPELYYMRGPGPACRAKRTGLMMSAMTVRVDAASAMVKLVKAHA